MVGMFFKIAEALGPRKDSMSAQIVSQSEALSFVLTSEASDT
jgi:hypothetical protein